MDGPLGSLFVGSLYGVGSILDRAGLWQTMDENLLEGSWIIGGDFNFMENHLDSSSHSSLLQGLELEDWHSSKLDLVFGMCSLFLIALMVLD